MKQLTPKKFSIEELEITSDVFSYLFLTFGVITEISLQYLPQHTMSFLHPDKTVENGQNGREKRYQIVKHSYKLKHGLEQNLVNCFKN